jgi:hypothetical protein
MSRKSLEFYALRDEQRNWLGQTLADKDLWCVVRAFKGSPTQCQTEGHFLSELQFEVDQCATYSLMLGHRELVASPVWRVNGAGQRDIDFIQSQAIEYGPAVVARGSVLLEGRLAIMSRVYYDDLGIDPQPLQKWFNRLARSFARLKAPGIVLAQHTTSGTTKKWSGVIVTPGAAAWRRKGGQLKQSVDGSVEFDVQTGE